MLVCIYVYMRMYESLHEFYVYFCLCESAFAFVYVFVSVCVFVSLCAVLGTELRATHI